MTPELLRRLPKTDLHCHLDGSLRLSTIVELAREQGVELPVTELGELAQRLHIGAVCQSLEHYLEAFSVTLAVLKTHAALSRVARELAEDAESEGVWALELRFSPELHRGALSHEDALVAVLEGLAEARSTRSIHTGVIICGLRHLPPEVNVELARLAVRYRDRGVVAFDLAGGEAGSPARPHVDAFDIARDGDLGITVHAGEAAGAESIREAVHLCGAHRIGHGVRLFEDERLLALVNDRRIALELCPSSNEQTRAVGSLAEHPLGDYLRRGIRVTVNTDNRVMSGTDASRELYRTVHEIGLSQAELSAVLLNGFKAAFIDRAKKKAMIERAEREIGLLLSPAGDPSPAARS